MVETRTKQLPEASVDEFNECGGENEADGSYNSQELTGINMPHVEEEMVYLHNPSQYTSSLILSEDLKLLKNLWNALSRMDGVKCTSPCSKRDLNPKRRKIY